MAQMQNSDGGKWKKKEKGTYQSSELNRLLYGTVNKVYGDHGFLKPEKYLPSPYENDKNIYFDNPLESSVIKQGQQAVFILRKQNFVRPNVADIEFPGVTYDRECSFPYIDSQCGHIRFKTEDGYNKSRICVKPCTNILSCGHRCPKKCSEKCLKKCKSCFEQCKQRKDQCMSSDPDDILYGTVVGIHEGYGFVKPDFPLPPPYNSHKDIHFGNPENSYRSVREGDRAVLLLNMDCHAKPCVTDIAFVGVSYDPNVMSPYKNSNCGHICFREKNSSVSCGCLKKCSRTLSCGHPCEKKCSEQCFKVCPECFQKRQKTKDTYTLSDLDDLLYGTVKHVSKTYGFLKPDRKLPKGYNASKDIHFTKREDDGLSIMSGQKVVFVLNKQSYDRPSAFDIAYIDESYDSENTIPYKNPQCGHICFKNKGGPVYNVCYKDCLKTLPCGCPCPEICSEICPSDCVDCDGYFDECPKELSYDDCPKTLSCGHPCQKKRFEKCYKECPACYQKKQRGKKTYKLSDLDDLLYGTVTTVDTTDRFGLLKPDRKLPEKYKHDADIYFNIHEDDNLEITSGQKAVFLLNNESYDRPSVSDIAFVGESYDPQQTVPYKRKQCGHICFREKGKPEVDKCHKACSNTLPCGHKCSNKCSEKCFQRCDACFVKHKQEKRSYTLAELDGILFGTVVGLTGGNIFINPDKQLPLPYNAKKDVFFHERDSNSVVSKGNRVVFRLLMGKEDKPAASQILILDDSFDSNTMEPYIREKCGHICLSDNRMQNDLCFNRCSKKLSCGHVCTEICSFPCSDWCKKCRNIRSEAVELFNCPNTDDICIGFVSFVGEGHGYIKPLLPKSDLTSSKSTIYFTFTEMHVDQLKRGLCAVYTLKDNDIDHPTVAKLAIVEDEKDQHFGLCYVNQLVKPKPKRKGQISNENDLEKLEIEALRDKSNMLRSWNLLPNRHPDPNDPLDLNFRIAVAHFFQTAQKSNKKYEIESIDYYVKPDLVRKFRNKQSELEKVYGKGACSNYILAFHGTDRSNIERIVQENFKLERGIRSKYGRGIYLSEFVDVSVQYGKGLLLCKVLPGRWRDVDDFDHCSGDSIAQGYDSHRVKADANGYGYAHVIGNPDQILPCYVINYKEVQVVSKSNPSKVSTSTTHQTVSQPVSHASSLSASCGAVQKYSSARSTSNPPSQRTQTPSHQRCRLNYGLQTATQTSQSGAHTPQTSVSQASAAPLSSGSTWSSAQTGHTCGTKYKPSVYQASIKTTPSQTGASVPYPSASGTNVAIAKSNTSNNPLTPTYKRLRDKLSGMQLNQVPSPYSIASAPPKPAPSRPPPVTGVSIRQYRERQNALTNPPQTDRNTLSNSTTVMYAQEARENDLQTGSRDSKRKKKCIVM